MNGNCIHRGDASQNAEDDKAVKQGLPTDFFINDALKCLCLGCNDNKYQQDWQYLKHVNERIYDKKVFGTFVEIGYKNAQQTDNYKITHFINGAVTHIPELRQTGRDKSQNNDCCNNGKKAIQETPWNLEIDVMGHVILNEHPKKY